MLCELPKGKPGRPSESLTLDEATKLLTMADSPEFRETWIGVYVVLSLLPGARTEELRELRWNHMVAFDKEADRWRPVTEGGWDHEQFEFHVWRSVRETNDTKTRKSRRTIALPRRCVVVLQAWQIRQVTDLSVTVRRAVVLVFGSPTGARLDKDTVLRAFRTIIAA